MSNTVLIDPQGPDWPLGFIKVVTPGTPVGIMSLVDSTGVNDPNTQTVAGSNEYTVTCQQIWFYGYKTGATPPRVAANTGFVYIVRKPASPTGNTADLGVIVKILAPGESFYIASSALNRDVFSPYRYYIDADNANDGAFVTLLNQ